MALSARVRPRSWSRPSVASLQRRLVLRDSAVPLLLDIEDTPQIDMTPRRHPRIFGGIQRLLKILLRSLHVAVEARGLGQHEVGPRRVFIRLQGLLRQLLGSLRRIAARPTPVPPRSPSEAARAWLACITSGLAWVRMPISLASFFS